MNLFVKSFVTVDHDSEQFEAKVMRNPWPERIARSDKSLLPVPESRSLLENHFFGEGLFKP